MDDSGVSQLQYEADVTAALRDIRSLVRTYGLSWEQDSFDEIEHIVMESLENARKGP